MTESEEFNYIYCEKRYKKSGWLAGHIKKNHDDSYQLDKDMTIMRDNALDISNREAILNLSENSPWDSEDSPAPVPTSTPNASMSVPLCPKADNFIHQMCKSLPASFLTTLLPAPAFLQEINRSLQDQGEVSDLLDRFEKEIHCCKC